MSCDWDVFCKTCKSEMDTQLDANHRDELMTIISKHGPVIASLAPLFREAEHEIFLTTYYGHINVGWFAEHGSHELCAISEYGDDVDGNRLRPRPGE